MAKEAVPVLQGLLLHPAEPPKRGGMMGGGGRVGMTRGRGHIAQSAATALRKITGSDETAIKFLRTVIGQSKDEKEIKSARLVFEYMLLHPPSEEEKAE